MKEVKVTGLYSEFSVKGLKESLKQLRSLKKETLALADSANKEMAKRDASIDKIRRETLARKEAVKQRGRSLRVSKMEEEVARRMSKLPSSFPEKGTISSSLKRLRQGVDSGKLQDVDISERSHTMRRLLSTAEARHAGILKEAALTERATKAANKASQREASQRASATARQINRESKMAVRSLSTFFSNLNKEVRKAEVARQRQSAADRRMAVARRQRGIVGAERFNITARGATGLSSSQMSGYRSQMAALTREMRNGAISSGVYNTRLTSLLATMRATSTAANNNALSFRKMRSAFIALTATYTAYSGLANIANTGMMFQSMGMMGGAAFGEQWGENLSYLRGEVNRLGLDLQTATTNYAKFAMATKKAFTTDEIQDMFTTFSETSVVFGMEPERYNYMMLALQQMASKGVVSLEELKRQLGDHLPGALQIAAQAMEMTDGEFLKLVESGNLLSTEFLPKFAKQLKELNAPLIGQAMNRVGASQGRMFTDFQDIKKVIFNSGLDELLIGIFETVSNIMAIMKPLVAFSMSFITSALKPILWLVQLITAMLADAAEYFGDDFINLMEEIGSILGMIASFFIGGILSKGIQMLGKFASVGRAIANSFRAVSDYMAKVISQMGKFGDFVSNTPTARLLSWVMGNRNAASALASGAVRASQVSAGAQVGATALDKLDIDIKLGPNLEADIVRRTQETGASGVMIRTRE